MAVALPTPVKRTGKRLAGTAVTALVGLVLISILAVSGRSLLDTVQSSYTVYGVSDLALKDIPPELLPMYQGAAERFGVDWAIVAAIGKTETDHGRSNLPGVKSGENSAGAGGPMQFLASTWETQRIDGDGDGDTDRYDPADAIYSAANYLRNSGAPGDYQKAIFAYNHAQWYVDDIMAKAAEYRGSRTTVVTNAPGGGALPGSLIGTPGLAPIAGGDRVGALVAAMNQLEAAKVPYCYGGGHGTGNPVRPTGGFYCWGGNPLTKQYGSGDVGLDCSSSTTWLLQRVGYRVMPMVSGAYMSWGGSGPGRSVTIWANGEHVYLEVKLKGRSYYFGTSTSNYRNGPGWHAPRSGAGFVARHPEGL